VSAKALRWLREQHPCTPAGKPDPDAKLVLYALADMDNANDPDNTVWPSQKTLRQRTSLSISTIGKKLKQLEDGGYISRREHRHPSGPRKGQRTSDRISLNLKKSADPPVEGGEQPKALKAANDRRSKATSTEPRKESQEDRASRRARWEAGLGGEWRETGPWWDRSADTVEELVVSDPISGEVVASRGTFSNFQRCSARKRPTEMWRQVDVLDEILDRIRWVCPDNCTDAEFVGREFKTDRDEGLFDPVRDVRVIARLFEDPDLLDELARDTGSAGYRIVDAVDSVYEAIAVACD